MPKSKRTKEQNTIEAADKWLALDGIPTWSELLERLIAVHAALGMIHKIVPSVRIGKKRLCRARKTLEAVADSRYYGES